MKSMDNKKAIKAMEQHSLQKYLEKLAVVEMRKVTLFKTFPNSGTPNLSDPTHLILIKDPAKLVDLNSGHFFN